MIISDDLIKSGESGNGGWNKQQLAVLGINWPPYRGWRKCIIGKSISDSDAKKFIELKRSNIKRKCPEKTDKCEKIKKSKSIFINTKTKLSWEEQYKHPNWQKLRLIILNRDKFACVKCGDNQSQLHVHHFRYDKNKYIWEVNHSDLITLCDKCHEEAHGRKFKQQS